MHLFLTHTDTPFRMYREGLSFSDTRLMLSDTDTHAFDTLSAVCAFWSDHRLDDEAAWRENRAMRVDFKCKIRTARLSYIPAVEDARLLGNEPLSRLKELYDDGIRILTPMWQGVNRLGGAHDTDVGLTPYGRHAVSAAMEMGMLIDLSHASDRSSEDILKLATHYGVPVCATHSNFRAITPHTRNLTDRLAVRIAESGGVIGLCFVPSHVGMTKDTDALMHMYAHGLSLGLGNALALGSDFDGTDVLISPLTCAEDLIRFATTLENNGYTTDLIHALFYKNAATYFAAHHRMRSYGGAD